MAGVKTGELVEDTRFFPVIARLIECLRKELEDSNGGDHCYVGIVVGDNAPLGMMAGDCKGIAWIRPAQVFPSLEFPQPSETAQCGAPLAMTLEVGVTRRYPRAEGRNLFPDPQEMFNASRLYLSDMQAMRRAIVCCMKTERDLQHVLGAYDPIPAGNGLSGGTWTFTIG